MLNYTTMVKLPKKLQSGPFTWSEAKTLGVSQYELRHLLVNETIERLARGVYRAKTHIDFSEGDQHNVAILRVGQPSAICLISALAYHHLTDVIPKKTWVLVNANKITTQKDIRLWRRRNPNWSIGIKTLDGLTVTSIERTLVECLRYSGLIGGPFLVISSIRLALQENKTTMSELLKMAEKLGAKKKILPYLEALA
jgi:predicted transcriptional regulator of viral defense system